MDGGEEVGTDAISKAPNSLLVRERGKPLPDGEVSVGFEGKVQLCLHPHAEGVLIGAYLVP